MSVETQAVRKRPPLFRALGRKEPPQVIQVDGETYHCVDVLKHDSWAATAVYQGQTKKIVCKFNRQEHVFGVPMDWLGRWLAERERSALQQLSDLPGIPPVCGPIFAEGRRLVNAVAHDYIEGHPLGRKEAVADHFFPCLQQMLAQMHRRGIAYMDLHKRENILVGDDGNPYLIDFQVHLQSSPSNPLTQTVLGLFCRSDEYHLKKHILHHQGKTTTLAHDARPWWIRLHRMIAQPLRSLRRNLLTWFRIRKQGGHAETEHFPEDAVRRTRRAA